MTRVGVTERLLLTFENWTPADKKKNAASLLNRTEPGDKDKKLVFTLKKTAEKTSVHKKTWH